MTNAYDGNQPRPDAHGEAVDHCPPVKFKLHIYCDPQRAQLPQARLNGCSGVKPTRHQAPAPANPGCHTTLSIPLQQRNRRFSTRPMAHRPTAAPLATPSA